MKKRLEEEMDSSTVHEHFKKMMSNVVDRQKELMNNYHANTYALYGDGALDPQRSDGTHEPDKLEFSEPAKNLQTWGRVVWRGDLPEGVGEAELRAAKWVGDDQHGVLRIVVGGRTVTLTVQQQAVAPKPGEKDNGIIPGDGTVPAWSAAAQGRGVIPDLSETKATGVQMAFVQGGYEHQKCFDHPWTRWATLYSVAQIVHSTKVASQ